MIKGTSVINDRAIICIEANLTQKLAEQIYLNLLYKT